MGAPVRFQKAVPRSKENAAVGRREARRSALWAGSSLPLEGQVRSQDGPTGAAIRAREFRRSATLFGNAKGSKPTIWTEARRDAPRGNAPARLENMCTVKDDVEMQKPNIGASKGREIASRSLSSGRPKAGPVGSQ